MGYAFKLADDRIICRSRHTGIWIFQQKNAIYGYWATLRSWGERLSIREVTEAAEMAGVDLNLAIDAVHDQVRKGVEYSMHPLPEFDLHAGHTV